MKLFLDTNVILDLLGKREPFVKDAAAIVSLADKGAVSLVVSALSYSTTDYFLKKILSPSKSIENLRKFRTISEVVPLDDIIIDKSLNSNFSDFEDGLQYYSALKANCEFIITRNAKDFKQSDLTVLTPQEFLALNK